MPPSATKTKSAGAHKLRRREWSKFRPTAFPLSSDSDYSTGLGYN